MWYILQVSACVWCYWWQKRVLVAGSALLVHPVTEAAAAGVNVYLPGQGQVCQPQSINLCTLAVIDCWNISHTWWYKQAWHSVVFCHVTGVVRCGIVSCYRCGTLWYSVMLQVWYRVMLQMWYSVVSCHVAGMVQCGHIREVHRWTTALHYGQLGKGDSSAGCFRNSENIYSHKTQFEKEHKRQ